MKEEQDKTGRAIKARKMNWCYRFFAARAREVFRDFLRADFRGGTFAPFSRASLRPIAIACLRLVTLRPDPLFSVPFFLRRIVDATFFEADFPYFAMCTSGTAPANPVLTAGSLPTFSISLHRSPALADREAMSGIAALRSPPLPLLSDIHLMGHLCGYFSRRELHKWPQDRYPAWHPLSRRRGAWGRQRSGSRVWTIAVASVI